MTTLIFWQAIRYLQLLIIFTFYLLPFTFYLLPFNGLIAFLSAIGEYNFLTVTSSLYPRFLPSYTRDRFTVCEHELLVPEENFLYSFFTGEFS